jgi:hypothetical protein
MGNKLHPEVSKKNDFWIEKHRYYELKHFCLQYPIWIKARDSIVGMTASPVKLSVLKKTISDPVSKCAEAREHYNRLIGTVDLALIRSTSDCPELEKYLRVGVTKGTGYDYLRVNMDIPCCRESYYKLYRKFFWILNDIRN